jgi:hypothetical protein
MGISSGIVAEQREEGYLVKNDTLYLVRGSAPDQYYCIISPCDPGAPENYRVTDGGRPGKRLFGQKSDYARADTR